MTVGSASTRLRLLLFIVVAGGTLQPANANIAEQRELFVQVYERAEQGDWDPFERLSTADQQVLRDYVLWPDLRAAFLRATIARTERGEIESFLSQYGTLRPARELRYRYALQLVRSGDLAAYLNLYQQYYQGLEIARLDCLALRAEIAAGRIERVINRALDLWMVGTSQNDECDPLFTQLRDNQLLGKAEYRQRFELAIQAREFVRARWLAKSIDQLHSDTADQWLRAQNDPETFVRTHARRPDNETKREQLLYALERLTYKNAERAGELWSGIMQIYAFTDEQRRYIERHIALWIARNGLPGAYKALTKLPAAARDDEVLRWRARVSLRDANWTDLLADIALMSEKERAAEQWQYWRAVAFAGSGQVLAASDIFADLAVERSYYGFLAADELDQDYAFDHTDFAADEVLIAGLAARADLIRARELFHVGLDGRGRAEWDDAVGQLSANEKIQAAILAHRWGWHSRAISVAASVGEYDDLELRYPLPYQNSFLESARAASIPATWAYGVARSESLFMRDVRSSAGAIGLMQLMPATGRTVARELRLPYAGLNSLTDPDNNIRLGTGYLGQMADRYGGNQVLATAAYNAGPHRVDRWLPLSGPVDARVWIENIPFNETRKYVRRVLAAETIFHWRITGKTRRLSDALPIVAPAAASARVASH